MVKRLGSCRNGIQPRSAGNHHCPLPTVVRSGCGVAERLTLALHLLLMKGNRGLTRYKQQLRNGQVAVEMQGCNIPHPRALFVA